MASHLVSGNHYVFIDENRQITLVIPYRNPVKVTYVKQVIALIDDMAEEEKEESDESSDD